MSSFGCTLRHRRDRRAARLRADDHRRRRVPRADVLSADAAGTAAVDSARREVSCPSPAQLSLDVAPRCVECLDVVSFVGDDETKPLSQLDLDFAEVGRTPPAGHSGRTS